MLLVLAAGLQPARDRRGSAPQRRTLVPVIPIYLPPRSPSSCHSVPAGDCLSGPQLSPPSPQSHNCQRHYLHSAAPPSEPVPRFPPLRLLRRLPLDYVASSISGRRPRTLNNIRHPRGPAAGLKRAKSRYRVYGVPACRTSRSASREAVDLAIDAIALEDRSEVGICKLAAPEVTAELLTQCPN